MIERVLIAGLGSIGHRHLRLLRGRLPDAEIMVLRHDKCGDATGYGEICTTSPEDAIAFKPNIAVIATPAPFHTASAIALAHSGTHLLVEKPIAAQIGDAQGLVAAAQAANVVLQVGYNLRFLDSLIAFRTAVVSGRVGRILSVRVEVGQYLPDWRPNTDWRKAVSARSDLGGGVLLELSHEIDFLRWIFGDVATVRGWCGQQGGLDLNVEDTAHMILEFSKPTPEDATGPAPVASLMLDFVRRDSTRRCTAIGEDGTLFWDGIKSNVTLIHPDQTAMKIYDESADRDSSYKAQLDAFLQSVQHGAPVTVSGPDGVAALEIVEALRQSDTSGGTAIALNGKE